MAGKKVAFIGIDLTSRSNNLEEFYRLAAKLKNENNYVVTNIHWGVEYSAKQSTTQTEVAHQLIDNGVDLIIGHHPHVIQPMETYKNKAIFYSLGNFIFDQAGKETNEGFGVGTVFNGEKMTFTLFPYQIKTYQPNLLTPERAKIFCDNYLNDIQNHDGCNFVL